MNEITKRKFLRVEGGKRDIKRKKNRTLQSPSLFSGLNGETWSGSFPERLCIKVRGSLAEAESRENSINI